MTTDQIDALLADVGTIKVLLCLLLGAFFASAMRPRK